MGGRALHPLASKGVRGGCEGRRGRLRRSGIPQGATGGAEAVLSDGKPLLWALWPFSGKLAGGGGGAGETTPSRQQWPRG